jgi:GNAT superfamily N-acetyltransferase
MVTNLTLRHHTAGDCATLRDPLLGVYAAAHPDRMDKPWFAPTRFWRQIMDVYIPRPGFGLVTGWVGNDLVGYAMGNLREDIPAEWDAITQVMPEVPPGGPIYAFLELAVHPSVQRRGYGRRIHDALLERVAHLVVLVDNTPARRAYLRWGWVTVGELRPLPTAPAYAEAMALRLRRGPTGRRGAARPAAGRARPSAAPGPRPPPRGFRPR